VNTSQFSAKNPALRLHLHGVTGLRLNHAEGWAPLEWDASGRVTAAQWDGGSNYVVHGKWSRILHINLIDTVADTRTTTYEIELEVAADGYRATETIHIPLHVVGPSGFLNAHWQAIDQVPTHLRPQRPAATTDHDHP
jgi:hypothetical protein